MSTKTYFSVAVLPLTLVAVVMAETFSIDGPSPTHTAYPARTHYPDSLLLPDPNGVGEDIGGLGPMVSFPGELLPRHNFGPYGLRNVDAISSNHGALADAPESGYRVIFSVRRNDTGDFPSCVLDQNGRNQEAGDLFISTDAFQPVLPAGPHVQVGMGNLNVCFRNQDELDEVPSAPADIILPPETLIDNLDACDFTRFSTDATYPHLESALYYSVSIETDTDYAAYIFYLPVGWDAPPDDPLDLGPIFATREELWLTSGDDLDALVVFDTDDNGIFSPGDAVVLSLRRGSTNLNPGGLYHDGPGGAFLPNGGSEACAFLLYKDSTGTDWLSRLATYEQLGLGFGMVASYADIDALVLACPGDLNGDGEVGLSDLAELLSNYGTTTGALYTDGDLDGDGDVALADLAELLAHYGETCP